jgi:hypothetical protein
MCFLITNSRPAINDIGGFYPGDEVVAYGVPERLRTQTTTVSGSNLLALVFAGSAYIGFV